MEDAVETEIQEIGGKLCLEVTDEVQTEWDQ
jgi:hypothetical protein